MLKTALADAVFLTRPMLWIPVGGFCVFGYARACAANGHAVTLLRVGNLSGAAWVSVLLFSCVIGGVYVLNQLADFKADSRNAGFALLAHGNVSRRLAWVTAFVFLCGPLFWAAYAGLWAYGALCASAAVLGLVYSLPPFRWSGRPVLDFVSNALGYGLIAFAIGWQLGKRAVSIQMAAAALPYILLMAAGSISSTIPDIDGDRADGKRTTAVVLGAARANGLAAFFIVCAGGIAWFVGDWFALICAALATPFYLYCVCKLSPRAIELTYKAGGAATMLVACAVAPELAFGAIIIVVATLVYFRCRFGVVYPSLMPAHHAQ